jgi:anti-sigma factor RsiW
MKCEEFEMLMADALGDEITGTDALAFEQHIAQCNKCSAEYQSLKRSLQTLHSLPGPDHVSVERLGDRLVISPVCGAPRARLHRFGLATLRYAATILIAFVAGYSWHTEPAAPQVNPEAPSEAIEQRFVDIHAQKPERSHFAKCLLAVSNRRH